MKEDRQSIRVGLGQKGQMPSGSELHDTRKPEEAEVGGRDYLATRVVCPFCSAMCEIPEERGLHIWLSCWNCHQPFNY